MYYHRWKTCHCRRKWEKRFSLKCTYCCDFSARMQARRLETVPHWANFLLLFQFFALFRKMVTDFLHLHRFIDVGGQRSQRQRWCLLFEGITCILFLVATSEFDQVWGYFSARFFLYWLSFLKYLAEALDRNRLAEALEVFETIVNHRRFSNIAFILFLNKSDLLAGKVDF